MYEALCENQTHYLVAMDLPDEVFLLNVQKLAG